MRSQRQPRGAIRAPRGVLNTLLAGHRGPCCRAGAAPVEPVSGLVAILFTDVVSSGELLARVGDGNAHRILQAHHDLLAETAARHRGEEVKWLGDGLMVVFPSAAGALRCAIAMQLAARQPIGGERLAIRVGINAGETLWTETDYFGSAVVAAHRLCRAADADQILSSDVVVGLLGGRPEFRFSAAHVIHVGGLCPVTAHEVGYQLPGPQASAERLFADVMVELCR